MLECDVRNMSKIGDIYNIYEIRQDVRWKFWVCEEEDKERLENLKKDPTKHVSYERNFKQMDKQNEINALRSSLMAQKEETEAMRKIATETALELRSMYEKMDKIQEIVSEGVKLDIEYYINQVINE